MKPEKRKLINDLLESETESRREETLLAAGRVMRRRRYVRVAARSGAVLAAIVLATFWFQPRTQRSSPQSSAIFVAQVEPKDATPPTAKPKVRVEAINDEQLLALFPNTPVALATTADGKKRLIFPRPGDEARFVTRL